MARQLRIDYPGATYHVYSRGNQKQAIFLAEEDYFYFLKVLGDAYDRFGVVFLSYCLMPNHYHLMVQALSGGCSKAMHLINTAYSIYLNKKRSGADIFFRGVSSPSSSRPTPTPMNFPDISTSILCGPG